MKTVLVVCITLILGGCASVPKYEKMRTVEDALNDQNQDFIKPGMAITKKGAVVDITFEEVQEQKRRLVEDNTKLTQAMSNLKENMMEDKMKIRTLRQALGLNPEEPKAKGKCCSTNGDMIGFESAPSLSDELAAAKK